LIVCQCFFVRFPHSSHSNSTTVNLRKLVASMTSKLLSTTSASCVLIVQSPSFDN
jgi:hypothetical protein